MDISEYLIAKMNQEFHKGYSPQLCCTVLPKLKCVDGFTVSVQCHCGAYCIPAVEYGLNLPDRYTHIELGYPSSSDSLIAEYAEEPDELTHTVYPYVPVDILEQLIEKHGGLVGEKQ